MKKNSFGYDVYANITLTGLDLNLIQECCEAHYDGSVRALCRQGGTVYGWIGNMRAQESVIEERVNFRTCDLICKALEMANDPKLLVAQSVKRDFRNLLSDLNAEWSRVNRES